MTNERLRSQMAGAGLSITEVASKIEVDPKTVERWITKDRMPHRRYRAATARLLDADEAYLWPKVLDDVRTKSASQAEIVATYPHRGAVPDQLWNSLMNGVEDGIDVLVYAGLFLIDGQPDLAPILAGKASRGTRIRLLFGDPESPTVAQRGADEGSGDDLGARIRLSLSELREVDGVSGMEIRQHGTVLYNSIYRFDEDLLVNMHVYGTPAAQNPVMHLRRVPGGRLFDHYLRSFDRVWETATAWSYSRTA